MWDVLWTLRGTIPLVPQTGHVALSRMARMLRSAGREIADHRHDELTFDSPGPAKVFGDPWHPLAIFDRGRFWLAPGAAVLHYKITCRSILGFALAGVAFIAGFGFLSGETIAESLKTAALAFAWLYGGNQVLARLRAPDFLMRVALGGAV